MEGDFARRADNMAELGFIQRRRQHSPVGLGSEESRRPGSWRRWQAQAVECRLAWRLRSPLQRSTLGLVSRVQGLLSHLSAGKWVTFDNLLGSELTALGAPEDKVTLDGPRLRVDWRETGVVVTHDGDRPRSGGYGRELIERALPYQLDADTTYEMAADGVHCTIDVPASTVGTELD